MMLVEDMRMMVLMEDKRELKMEERKQEKQEKEKEKEEENKTKALMFKGFSEPSKLVVGYALTSKKTKSFLQPKLEVLARYFKITNFYRHLNQLN